VAERKRFDLAPEENFQRYIRILRDRHHVRSTGVIRCFTLSLEARGRYGAACQELQSAIDNAPELQPWLDLWPRFILKLALLLHISAHEKPAKEIGGNAVDQAAALMKSVGGKGLLWIQKAGLLKPTHELKEIADIDVLVAKVKMKGPLTRRDLVRCYHGKRLRDLEPVLAKAIEQGLVIESKGGLVTAEAPRA